MLRQGENSEEGFRGAGSRVGGCEKMLDNLWRGCPVGGEREAGCQSVICFGGMLRDCCGLANGSCDGLAWNWLVPSD